MIRSALLALVLVGAALAPQPAHAVSFPECQAFLCMPGGFPPPECAPARSAVLRRIRALLPALPAWSECVAAFDWDPANLTHNEDQLIDCPRGGNLSGRTCSYTTGDGCRYSYPARIRARAQVVVDGSTSFSPNHTFTAIARPDGDTYLSGGDPLICSPGGGGGGGYDSGVIGGPGSLPPPPICEPLTPGCDEDGNRCDPATDPDCPGECIPNTPACDEDGNRCDPATDPDCPGECIPNTPACDEDGNRCDPATDPDCPGECIPNTPACDEDGNRCDPATDPDCPGECIPNTPACDEDGNRCDPATDPDCPGECIPNTPACDEDGNRCDPATDPDCPPETPPCEDPNRRPSPPVPGTPARPEGSAYTTPIDTGLTCICPGNYPFPFFGFRGWICLPNPGTPVN